MKKMQRPLHIQYQTISTLGHIAYTFFFFLSPSAVAEPLKVRSPKRIHLHPGENVHLKGKEVS